MAKEQKTKAVPFLKRFQYHLVLLYAFLLYANTIPNQFNLDDELVTTTDEQYPHRLTSKGLGVIPEIFAEPYYKDASGYAYDYRPVVLTTYAIERGITGGNVHVSHFINTLLYALLCLVLLWALALVLKEYNPLIPLIATLLFAAFPLHTEVVASLKNRDEILALLFALLSTRFIFKCVTEHKGLNLLIALAFFTLALLSKSTIISLAVIIPVLLIILTPVSLGIPVLFAAVATAIYLPMSPLATLASAVGFLTFMIGLVVVIYAIHNYKSFSLPLFLRHSIADNKAVEKPWFSIIELKWMHLWAIGVVLTGLSTVLYLYNQPFYFVPVSLLLFTPYLTTNSLRPFLLGITAALGVFASLLLWPNDGLVAAFMIYFLLATFYFRSVFYITLPLLFVAGLAVKHGVDALHVLAIMAIISTVIWLPKKNIAGYAVAVLVLLSNVIVLAGNPGKFVTEEIYTLDIVNVILVLGFVAFPVIRRYLWLPAAVSILAMLLLFNRQGSFIDVSGSVNAIANQEIPQVIEVTKIERPISIAEAVTTPASPLSEKLGTAAQVFRQYFRLTLVPYPMAFYYGYKEIDKQSVFTPVNLLTLVVFAFLLLLALFYSRKWPLPASGLLIYLIGMGIYSNYVMPVPGMMADRFLFVPSLGFVLIISWLFVRFTGLGDSNKADWDWQNWPKILKGILGGLLVVYSIITITRNAQWENHLTLFSADINHISNSAQANNLYAVQLMKYSYAETDLAKQQQMRSTAELHFKKAIEIFPALFNAWYDLARTQNILGKNAEAEETFIKASKLNPTFPTTWLSAGELALMRKQPAVARSYYQQGLNYIKNDPAFYIQLSFTYFLEAKYDSANMVNKRGMDVFPQKVDFPSNLAQTFAVMGKVDSALYYYNKALLIEPSNKAILEAVARIKAGIK